MGTVFLPSFFQGRCSEIYSIQCSSRLRRNKWKPHPKKKTTSIDTLAPILLAHRCELLGTLLLWTEEHLLVCCGSVRECTNIAQGAGSSSTACVSGIYVGNDAVF